jgi:DNA-directed RNA polymerase sigma subunit (sigma70/sigma32)
VTTWDPDRGPLVTHIWWKMRGALTCAKRKRPLVRHGVPRGLKAVTLPLTEPLGDIDDIPLGELLADPKATPIDLRFERLELVAQLLPPHRRQREILFRRAVGESLRAIGEDLGLTRERIRQLELRALDHAKRRAALHAQ